MKTLILILTTIFSGCGQLPNAVDVPGNPATSEQPKVSAAISKTYTVTVTSTDTATVTSTEIRIIQGAKGDKGDPGQSIVGPAGPAGKDGVDGKSIVGPQGAIGAQGVAGQSITGAQGIQGISGLPGHDLNVVDSTGASIGSLWNETSDGALWVSQGSMRFEIAHPAGTFTNAYMAFSGLNCTGTKRVILLNGMFANVFVDARDGSLIRASGTDQGVFNYLSRVPQGTSCQNATGSTTQSWAATVPTLSFGYPVSDAQISN